MPDIHYDDSQYKVRDDHRGSPACLGQDIQRRLLADGRGTDQSDGGNAPCSNVSDMRQGERGVIAIRGDRRARCRD